MFFWKSPNKKFRTLILEKFWHTTLFTFLAGHLYLQSLSRDEFSWFYIQSRVFLWLTFSLCSRIPAEHFFEPPLSSVHLPWLTHVLLLVFSRVSWCARFVQISCGGFEATCVQRRNSCNGGALIRWGEGKRGFGFLTQFMLLYGARRLSTV